MFVELKALGGVNFVRADFVIAVTSNDPAKCYVFVQGSANSIPISEPVKTVVEKLEAALKAPAAPA
ncbi:MAG: hypothetical protein JNK46_17045 [Methylobacteriaceae bacterium]|nr:hypothetical protein [Methylobacteriaceae bacterium]